MELKTLHGSERDENHMHIVLIPLEKFTIFGNLKNENGEHHDILLSVI